MHLSGSGGGSVADGALGLLVPRQHHLSISVELRQRHADTDVAEDDHYRRNDQRDERVGVVDRRHYVHVLVRYLHQQSQFNTCT